jgi:hypothetical protein
VLGRQLQNQAAAIPQGEQVRQEQEHPQVGALAVHIRGHPGQGVGDLLPGQPRQHARVGAECIAVEAGRPGGFQPLDVAGLGFLDAAGEVHRPAAGAVREFEQSPAVADQLQAVPQAREGGVFQPGELVTRVRLGRGGGTAGGRCTRAAGGGHLMLAGSSPLPEASMGYRAIHARFASCWSGRQGKQVDQFGGLGFLCGSAEEPRVISSVPKVGSHTAGLIFNSEWLRVLMRTAM